MRKLGILLGIFFGLSVIALLANLLFLNSVKKTTSNAVTNTDRKVCYLTFDDGPSKNTKKVLDILQKYDVKATFFLIGSEIEEEDKQVLIRMKEEGHSVGLHSNVHDFDKIYVSVKECVEDYRDEQQMLFEKYEINTSLFRFPGGSACMYMNGQRKEYVQAMQEKGFRCFDWHVSGEDSVGSPTVYSIQKKVEEGIADYQNPIILLHDSGIADATVDALPGIIENIEAQGYEFATLEDREEYIFRSK